MTFQELINMYEDDRPAKLKITEAAAMMDVTPRFLQMGLQHGCFPFGCGIEMTEWAYYINTERFIRYMTGQPLTFSTAG